MRSPALARLIVAVAIQMIDRAIVADTRKDQSKGRARVNRLPFEPKPEPYAHAHIAIHHSNSSSPALGVCMCVQSPACTLT